jgi:hypothetical protein
MCAMTGSKLWPRVEDRIRNRAYELYLEGGKQEGRDIADWLQAESEVQNEKTDTNRRPKKVAA